MTLLPLMVDETSIISRVRVNMAPPSGSGPPNRANLSRRRLISLMLGFSPYGCGGVSDIVSSVAVSLSLVVVSFGSAI
jgi:hypothetical protein